jgi:hypothetical protein
MILAVDIETDWYTVPWEYEGDEPKILCLVAIDADTKNIYKATTKEEGFAILSKATQIIMHNGVEYDLRVMNELWGLDYEIAKHDRSMGSKYDKVLGNNVRIIDTFILSRMVYPERFSHGLESYTVELGTQKPQVDFDEDPIDLILHRCEEDCWTTLAVYNKILKDTHGQNIKDAYSREKHVSDINQKREMRGIGFDLDLALEHCKTLDAEMRPLADKVLAHLPDFVPLPPSKIKLPPKKSKRIKKDGFPSKHTESYFGDRLFIDEVTHTWQIKHFGPLKNWPDDKPLVSTRPMTMKDSMVIKKWLMSKGWKPSIYNKDKEGNRTSPKIRDNGNICPNLIPISERIPEIKDYILYNTLQHRRNTLKSVVNDSTGLCNNVRLAYDGRLTPGANTLGAVTRRFTHREVANIPRPSSIFGKEMREVFIP